MNKTVAVTSGKGGTGKSTFAVNLALAAIDKGQSVLLVDMDAGMRCLDLLLNVAEGVVMDVSDAVGGVALKNAAVPVTNYTGLWLLAAPSSQKAVEPEAFSKLILSAADEFDLVIIDFPAGTNYAFYKALPKSTEFITVCNPDPISVRDAAETGRALRSLNKKGWLIINKYSYKYVANQRFSNLDDILDETGQRLLGIVPFSQRFVYSFSTGTFPKRGREKKAFKRIFARLCDENVPLPNLKKI